MIKTKIGTGWPYDVTKKDLEITYCRGTGAGGQKRNKTSNVCNITHTPTGIQVRAGEERMASQNLKVAFTKLSEKLIPLMKKLIREKEGTVTKEEVLDRIRTYNEKDNRVVDERITDQTFNYDNVLKGKDFDKIVIRLKESRK